MGKLPFDLAEAEQELQEGPLSEYSGSGFGVMKWGISLKQLVVLQMFVGVFIPWGQMETFTAGGLLLPSPGSPGNSVKTNVPLPQEGNSAG